jgi:hypothetical protein
MRTKLTIGIIAVAAIMMALGPVLVGVHQASARITQETTCTNHNGDVIGSSCPGSSAGPGQGHTESSTCNHNPSSTTRCPPGQN